ncbi:MAG: hypothetical protein R2864_15165 [Syntrophotaleaceae bacterium]
MSLNDCAMARAAPSPMSLTKIYGIQLLRFGIINGTQVCCHCNSLSARWSLNMAARDRPRTDIACQVTIQAVH